MFRSVIFMAATALALFAFPAEAIKGKGTAYTKAGDYTPNACDYKKGELSGHFNTYFAAVDQSQYHGGSVCGKCVRVYGATGKGVLFKVIDYCASGCDSGDLDFSRTGLKATTGYDWDEKPISWDWTSCDGPKFVYGTGRSKGRSRGKSGKGRKLMEIAA